MAVIVLVCFGRESVTAGSICTGSAAVGADTSVETVCAGSEERSGVPFWEASFSGAEAAFFRADPGFRDFR
jgi:hypothetical protein